MRTSDPPIHYLVGTPKVRYLLRSNLGSENPAQLWQLYVLLTQIEQAALVFMSLGPEQFE
jgi:hypothetical protein